MGDWHSYVYKHVAFLLLASTLALDIPTGLYGHEKKLFQNMTSSYNSISRPVRNSSHQVNMTFGVTLNQILDLDEKHQILSTYLWIHEKWLDENLQWNPDEFNGLRKLMFPSSHIWVPDIYIFNSAGSSLDGFVNVSGSYVLVTYTGHVQWSVPLLINSACPVDATYFPYDKQTCDIHFGSWIYDISQVDIGLDPMTPDLTQYVINNEFDLDGTTLKNDMVDSSCCPGNGAHPMVHLTIRIKRKTIYYDYIVIAPTINLCVMTLATFLLPCECGWKIAIGLTVFLTLYVLQLLIAENVPDTNSTPLISVFLLLVMSLNSISLIMATIIMNIKRRANHDPIPNVPPYLLHFCEHYLSKIVCTKRSDWRKLATAPSDTMTVNGHYTNTDDHIDYNNLTDQESELYQLQNLINKRNNIQLKNNSFKCVKSQRHEMERTFTAESSFSAGSSNDNFVKEIDYKDNLITSDVISPHPNINHSFTTDDEDNLEHIDSHTYEEDVFEPADEDNNQISIKKSRNRQSYKKAIRRGHYTPISRSVKLRPRRATSIRRQSVFSGIGMKYQWYFVADVIDTMAFLIYVIVMVVGIVTVLVIVPLFA